MPLPTDLAEAHALILRQREEMAAAEARASGAETMIAHMKLVIAKLCVSAWKIDPGGGVIGVQL